MKVPLTQGRFTTIDEKDWPRVQKHKWCVANGYAFSRKTGYLHRWLLGAKNREVLHRNNDGLDNRRANLLLCSRAETMYKQRPQVGCTSQYKGVFRRKSGRYYAYCFPPNSAHAKRHLGSFENEEDAARAYDDAVREMYGDLAKTNFESV